jgi:hypothetical protein
MSTETPIASLGNHLLCCEQCSIENEKYCSEFLELFASLLGYMPDQEDTASNRS